MQRMFLYKAYFPRLFFLKEMHVVRDKVNFVTESKGKGWKEGGPEKDGLQ